MVLKEASQCSAGSGYTGSPCGPVSFLSLVFSVGLLLVIVAAFRLDNGLDVSLLLELRLVSPIDPAMFAGVPFV